jgi:pimeloyl-ACP methyl ester carboxylesterase
MGGWVALLYAYQHPESVERIVLVNGGPYQINSTYNITPETREDARKVMGALQDPASPHMPNFVLDDVVRTSHSGPIGRLKQVSQQEFVLDGKLAGLSVPVDILWGEADRMMGTEYAKRLDSEIPSVRLNYLPHCGHIPQRECPAVFTTKLTEVLRLPAPENKQLQALKLGR